MLWLFTRVPAEGDRGFGEGRPVVVIKKTEQEQRLFCVFGTLDRRQESKGEDKYMFKFFKNQEVPEFYYSHDTSSFLSEPTQKSLENDSLDFSLTL